LNTFRFLLPFARPYWRSFLGGMVLVPISTASTLMIPWLTGDCVELLRRTSAAAGDGDGLSALTPYLAGILALALIRGLTLFSVRWLVIGASRHAEYDLRNHLFRHLQTLDQSYYHHARTGDILSRLSSDVERVRLVVGPIVMYSASTACMLAFAVPLMVSVSLPLTLLILVPLSFLTVAVRRIGPRVHAEVMKAQETYSDLSSLAQEDFSGIRVIKAFAQEEVERTRFREVAERYLAQNLRVARISAWMDPVVGAVAELGLLILLAVGGLLMLADRVQLGDFIKFAGYQTQLVWPMISIGWVINQYHRASASMARLEEILTVEPAIREPPAATLPEGGRIRGHVSIRDLSLQLAGRAILDRVSIEAPAGSLVAIVGRIGSGKSTLVNCVPRLVAVPDGTVFVDGVDVNQLPLSLLRGAIGLVPQESFLFSRTIRDNIAFAAGAPTLEEVVESARLARFDKDIDQFPRAYDEMVGERGITLSGGQRQRAALARALTQRPRILILDDAFSQVDTETEKEIVRNLHAATAGMTTIVVAHRISSVLGADLIYVLDEGRVVEEGRHEELVKLGGIYAQMHRRQLLREEIDRL
jgi:ATP-binding cassette subfamily B protein